MLIDVLFAGYLSCVKDCKFASDIHPLGYSTGNDSNRVTAKKQRDKVKAFIQMAVLPGNAD